MEDGLGKKGICKGLKPPLPYNPFFPFLGLSSTERRGGRKKMENNRKKDIFSMENDDSRLTISFRIEGEAVGKMRPKVSSVNGHPSVYTPHKQVVFENWVRMCYLSALNRVYPNFKGILFEKDVPVKVNIEIVKRAPVSASKRKRQLMLTGEINPTSKPDVDNVAKSILDALNKTAFYDDSQVVDLTVSKHYAEGDYIVVTLIEIKREASGNG